ncbi:MAG: KH domain-containing protein [Candidatus Riflebacteria bacterium]|nr:KH domain-containing protein [Candidatus Riflebacteria bacterium]
MPETLRALISTVVKAIVEHPDEVMVKPIEGEGTIVFEVQVNPDDAGKVIGKKGRTINALRTVIRANTALGNKKVMMELV